MVASSNISTTPTPSEWHTDLTQTGPPSRGGGGSDVKSDKKIFCGKTQKNYLIKWQRKEKESSDHTSACYVPLVLGKPTKVLHGTRLQLQDSAKKAMTKQAAEYVNNLVERWIDAFMLTAAGYKLTSCECLKSSS